LDSSRCGDGSHFIEQSFFGGNRQHVRLDTRGEGGLFDFTIEDFTKALLGKRSAIIIGGRSSELAEIGL